MRNSNLLVSNYFKYKGITYKWMLFTTVKFFFNLLESPKTLKKCT